MPPCQPHPPVQLERGTVHGKNRPLQLKVVPLLIFSSPASAPLFRINAVIMKFFVLAASVAAASAAALNEQFDGKWYNGL